MEAGLAVSFSEWPPVSDYRFYTLTQEGRIAGPPGNYWLPDDAAAVKRAKLIINESPIEVWQGDRVVARLVPEQEQG